MEEIGSWSNQQQGGVMMKRAAMSLCAALLGLGALSGASRAAAVEEPTVQSAYSAPALYDLGNTYARMGRPAMAVLNYERALVLAPTDPDIRANLRHVRESVGTPTPTGGWLRHHARWANPDTLYWIGLLGLILAGASLLLRRQESEYRTVLGAGIAIGVAFMALALGDAMATASTLHESVAMFATPASASPISGGEPLFTVPLADLVSVREAHGGFVLITDSQGREGWVPVGNLQPVIPRSEAIHGFPQIIHLLAT
jgi:Tetratricopeptide repeat